MNTEGIHGIHIPKDKNVVTILTIDTGRVPFAKASTVASDLQAKLRAQKFNVIVIHGTVTNGIEVYKDQGTHQIVCIPRNRLPTKKLEAHIKHIHDELTKFGIKQFSVISVG